MKPPLVAKRLRALVTLCAAFYVVTFATCAVARVLYPYELDFCEGALAAVLARVEAHLPIYVAPGVHFTSMVYTPLDFQVAAALDRLHPGVYFGLRTTSVLATFATAGIIAVVARRHRAPWFTVAAAVGVFFGASSRCAFIQDSAHVDALALLFAIVGLAVLFEGNKSPFRAVVGGALVGLGFLTKQTMIVFVAMPLGWLLVERQWMRALAFLTAALAMIVGLLAHWELLSNPWFYFWVLKLESTAKLRLVKLFVEAPLYLVVCLPVGLVVGVLGGVLDGSWREWPRRAWADPWAVCTLAYAGMSIVAKAKDGGGQNVFLPVFALTAMQLGRHAHALLDWSPHRFAMLVLLQLVILVYPPTLFWPTEADRKAGDRIVEQIAKFPGEVYVPAFPAYAVRAGKSWWVHYTVVCGLAQFDQTLRQQIGQEIRAQRFSAIFPRTDVEWMDIGICDLPGLDEYYEPVDEVAPVSRPSVADVLSWRPSVAAIAHGGKLGRIYVPRRAR